MKKSKTLLFMLTTAVMLGGSSCSAWNKAFGPKYGCPANGKAFGAERVLSGEKAPKTKKFKA